MSKSKQQISWLDFELSSRTQFLMVITVTLSILKLYANRKYGEHVYCVDI